MKIFSAAQIRAWDAFTMQHEPVRSIDLMERAAATCAEWILKHTDHHKKILIFCGNGNNGGDGLAIARLLLNERGNIAVYTLSHPTKSADCETNLHRLMEMQATIHQLASADNFPEIDEADIVIDALYGTGINKPLEGLAQMLVEYINKVETTVISIDLPSGLFCDISTLNQTVVRASHTISFQGNKLAFMLTENAGLVGNVSILDIGLSESYYQDTTTDTFSIDKQLAQSIYRTRKDFTHKYNYGHALLYAGSKNMMGAAVLTAKSCLRSGAGLVTVHTAAPEMPVIQTAVSEAICSAETDHSVLWHKKSAIGIGPGLALCDNNATTLQQLITGYKGALVIDASALSLLKPYLHLLAQRTSDSILTPHTGEFENLFEKCATDFDRMAMALQKAAMHNCYIILKSHHTLIACPDGECYFNTTGNSGMATAGSGDVLTGIITGLLSQGYTAREACLLGVYLHGHAGDLAALAFSKEAMIAGDIIDQLGNAFKTFQ